MSIFIFGGVSSFRDFPDDYIFSPGYCNSLISKCMYFSIHHVDF